MRSISNSNMLTSFLQSLFYAGLNSGSRKKFNKIEFYLDNFQEVSTLHMMSTKPYPAKLYKDLKNFLNITGTEYKYIMGHTWKTVQTKKANELLSVDYSEKLITASKVWTQGIAFFGNDQKFNHWLRQFNPFLDSRPIDLLTTISGSEMVADELDRMKEGILA